MLIRIIELLEGVLKVRNHLFDLFPAPAIFTLENINGKSPVRQDLCKSVGFINLIHATTSIFSLLLFSRLRSKFVETFSF